MEVFKENVNTSIESYKNSSYEKVKKYERFKFLSDHVLKMVDPNCKILDIGCAKGEFIYYLKSVLNDETIKYCGFDLSDELIAIAKNEPELSGVKFVTADVLNFELNEKFDILIMSGVLSIFDDFEKPLRQMFKHMHNKSVGYIFGCFNDDDIDVIVRYRNNYAGSTVWESGYNNYSLKTIDKFIKTFCNEVNLYKFDLSIDLPKEDDPVKSFTLNTVEKGRIITCGAKQITDFWLIEVKDIVDRID